MEAIGDFMRRTEMIRSFEVVLKLQLDNIDGQHQNVAQLHLQRISTAEPTAEFIVRWCLYLFRAGICGLPYLIVILRYAAGALE